jgi:hypothetical protein
MSWGSQTPKNILQKFQITTEVEMGRFLSAIILGGSLVVGAFLMSPPRYEVLQEEPSEWLQQAVGHVDARRYGVFDRRTGEVCYRIFRGNVEVVPSDEDGGLKRARCAAPSGE